MSNKEFSNYSTISVERKGQVDWLTINRPDALNALNMQMTDELIDYFSGLSTLSVDLPTRIVVFRAAGKIFSAGLDMKERPGVVGTVQESYTAQEKFRQIIKLMRRCPQPIVALLHGAVCGGGFAMALGSDIRIASSDCRMNAAFIKIGLGGGDLGTSYLLPRLVGTSVASELLLTGRFIDAERALRVNLVSEVVEKDQLEQAADGYITDMLDTAPMGLRLTKEALNYSVDAPSIDAAMALEDRQQILLGQTEDHREAVTAFFEKRPPNYKNK